MRLPRSFALIVLGLALTAPAHASLKDHKTLVVEGRTIDAEGFPIERVRLRLLGGHRASVTSNADGQFSIRIPLGTLHDLQHAPLRLAMEAERRGYRFAVPAGDERLALDLGLEAGSEGTSRCVARSNDERVAASAARVVSLEGEAVALVMVNFIGAKGEPSGDARSPKLPYVAQVALDFPLSGPVAALPREPGEIDTVGARPQGEPKSWSIVREPERRGPAAGDRKKAKRAREDRAMTDLRVRASADSAAEVAREMERAAKRAAKTRQQQERLERSRRLASLSPLPGTSAGKLPRGERTVDPGLVPSADAAPADTALERGRAAEAARVAVRPPPPPTPAPTPAPSGPVIIPNPGLPVGRARSRPLVISNPAPGSHSDSCECRVEGTVEVQTVVPIKNRQRIEVSLQWYPMLRDTVELFMGPPRPFRLPVAPCGPQRLRVRVLDGQHFDVASREAMAGFRCEGGRLYQPRIVLSTR
jgi:hypothetical protein